MVVLVVLVHSGVGGPARELINQTYAVLTPGQWDTPRTGGLFVRAFKLLLYSDGLWLDQYFFFFSSTLYVRSVFRSIFLHADLNYGSLFTIHMIPFFGYNADIHPKKSFNLITNCLEYIKIYYFNVKILITCPRIVVLSVNNTMLILIEGEFLTDFKKSRQLGWKTFQNGVSIQEIPGSSPCSALFRL